MVEAGAILVRRHYHPADRLQGQALGRRRHRSSHRARAGVRGARRDFNEFWWFFPQNGQPYNTRCIIYNYRDGWWSQGTMSRSAGITSSFTAQTIMADGLVAFEHELGDIYGNAELPFAETFDLNLTIGHAADHGQADDARRRGQHRQSALFALLPKQSLEGRSGIAVAAAAGARRTAMSTSAPRGETSGFGSTSARRRCLPVTVGQHLVDAVPRGDR